MTPQLRIGPAGTVAIYKPLAPPELPLTPWMVVSPGEGTHYHYFTRLSDQAVAGWDLLVRLARTEVSP